MSQLSQKDLQFCFDELLGELGWGDEIEQTGVDPLVWARNEIKDLHKQVKSLRGSFELRNAAEQRVHSDVCHECGAINAFEYDKERRGEVCVRCGTRR